MFLTKIRSELSGMQVRLTHVQRRTLRPLRFSLTVSPDSEVFSKLDLQSLSGHDCRNGEDLAVEMRIRTGHGSLSCSVENSLSPGEIGARDRGGGVISNSIYH